MAEVIVQFESRGSEEVLNAAKTVSRNIGDLQRLAATPIHFEATARAMPEDDLKRLRDSVGAAQQAASAFEHMGIAYERAASRMKAPLFGSHENPFDFAKQFSAKSTDGVFGGAASAGPTSHMGVEFDATAFSKVRSPLQNVDDVLISNGQKDALDFAKKFSPAAVDAGKKAEELAKRTNKATKEAEAASRSFGFLSRILAAMAIRSAVHGLISFADAFTNLQNKIKTVTNGEGSLGFMTKQLYGVAQGARTSLESVVTMFTRTSRAVEGLGKSQMDVVKFTDTLSKAIVVGGSNAIEASNAMIQLSQGMGSGTLKGDELRSVLEQLPIVAQIIADKMGVPISALRKLGSEGKLTTEVIFEAVSAASEGIEEKFGKLTPTVGQALTMLRNKAVLESERLQDSMGMLARGIMYVTDNFDSLIPVAQSAMLVLGELGLAKVIMQVTTAFKALWVTMQANPWVALASAIALAATALIPFVADMATAKDSIVTFGDIAVATWDEVSSEFSSAFNPISTTLDDTNTKISKINESTKDWILTLAGIADTVLLPLTAVGSIIGGIIIRMQGGSQEDAARGMAASSDMFTTLAKNAMKRAEDQAFIDDTERMLNEEKEALAADLANDAGEKRNKTAADAKKGKGKTFDDLMRELEMNRMKTSWTDDSSDPSLLSRVAIEALDAVNSLDEKIRNSLTPAQLELVKGVIEEKVTLEDMLKLREQIQDAIEKQREKERKALEEYSQKFKKFKKEQEDLVKTFQESRADRETSRFEKFQGIADNLDPSQAITREIKEVKEFMEKFKDFPDWIALAQSHLDDLYTKLKYGGIDPFKTFGDQIKSIFGPDGTLVKGLGDATAKWLVMNQSMREFGQNLKNLLNSVTQQAVSSLIQMPLNMLTGSLYGGASPGALPTGPAGVTYLPGTSSTIAPHKFASGGYTGNYGLNEPAGVVHGQEYVLNASATKRMGLSTLEAINKGGPMPKSGGTNVTVHNYAGVQVETNSTSPDQVEIMITKAIQQQTARVVASHLSDSNSPVSKTLRRNYQIEKRSL